MSGTETSSGGAQLLEQHNEQVEPYSLWWDSRYLTSDPRPDFEVTSGDFNTVLITDGKKPYIIKSPKVRDINNIRLLNREIEIVDELDRARWRRETEKGDWHTTILWPNWYGQSNNIKHVWSAYSMLPGRVFSWQEIWDEFSLADYRDLGRMVCKSTLELSKLLEPDSFRREIEDTYPGTRVPDREVQLLEHAWDIASLQARGYRFLADATMMLLDDHHALHDARLLTATHVIHDDLHPGNLGFVEVDNNDTTETSHDSVRWRLAAAWDFANTKMGSPSRDFRFLPFFHPEAVRSAIETWHDLTGETIRDDVVLFWARVQIVVLCAGRVIAGKCIKQDQLVRLKQCYPQYDWGSELPIER